MREDPINPGAARMPQVERTKVPGPSKTLRQTVCMRPLSAACQPQKVFGQNLQPLVPLEILETHSQADGDLHFETAGP